MLKTIGYAYPYSPHAEKLGFEKEGCFYFATVKEHGVLSDMKGFNTEYEALDHAATCNLPWSMYSIHEH